MIVLLYARFSVPYIIVLVQLRYPALVCVYALFCELFLNQNIYAAVVVNKLGIGYSRTAY